MSDPAEIIADAIVWDQLFPTTEACGEVSDHKATLDRMQAEGFTAVSLSMAYDPDDAATAIDRISRWRRVIDARPDTVFMRTGDDVRRAKADGALAVGFHFQGSTPFERDIGLVRVFHDLGIRQAVLAYNIRNHVGDGCMESQDAGLSDFGRLLVAEMHRVGVFVDGSHSSARTVLDAIEVGTGPVVYSHANAAMVHDHPRNITDDLAKAVASSGGIVGVNGVSVFLGDKGDLHDLLFAHVDHWVQLLGAERVGLGLDVVSDIAKSMRAIAQSPEQWPEDYISTSGGMTCCGPDCILPLVERMLAAGYSAEDCRAVLGGNWLRLAEQLWSGIGEDA